MSIKTFVQVTADESSPGVPLWSANQNITQVPDGETTVAIENLVAGRKYYVQTWNEDEFGNRSPSVVRVVQTAAGVKTVPIAFSANGYLDDASPMRAFVKIADDVQSVSEVIVTLAFRQFMAPATDAASSGTLTSSSGGGATSGSGGGSTSGTASHEHYVALHISNTPGGYGAQKYTDGDGGMLLDMAVSGTASPRTSLEVDPSTGTVLGGHTHTVSSHTHTTPDHTHNTPGHTHALTYGTFEETYPASHSVTVKVFQRVVDTWTLVYTSASITDDLADLDLSNVIIGPGDWRLEVLSDAGQPNSGRLGCDLYGAITAVTSGSASDGLAGIGTAGPAGTPGVGVATGGTAGQVLYKVTGADYDTGWLTLGTAAAAATTDFDAAGDAAAAQAAAETYADGVAAAAQAAAEAASQPLDADLTDIAALAPPDDDVMQRKAGHWVGRTIIQFASDLGLGALAYLGSLAHSALTGIGTDDHHAKSHAHSGADGSGTVAHSATTGRTTDDHHAQLHHAAHEPGGGDAMAVDASAATGSLRTLGTGAAQAAAGNDSRLSDSRTPTAHGASLHNDITRSIFLDVESATLDPSAGGTFANIGSGSPALMRAIALADAATQGAIWTFAVPSDWASGVLTVQPVWAPGSTDASSHAVRWQYDTAEIAAGVLSDVTSTTQAWTGASAARTAKTVVYDTATTTGVTPSAANNLIRLHVERAGGSASDTYVGVVNLIGLLVTYTANQ